MCRPCVLTKTGCSQVYPKRLAMHEDPAGRLLFSHWNTAICEWAASDWADGVRAQMPRAHVYPPELGDGS